MLRFRVSLVLLAAAFICFPAVAANPAKILETTEIPSDAPLRLNIPAGSRLEVKGVWGELDVLLGDGPESVVTIERPAGGPEPRLVLLRHDEGYTLCTVHASGNAKKPNECVPGKKGRMLQGNRKDWPRVNFTVEIPHGVQFLGMMFGDRIAARAGMSDLDLELDRGTIFIHDDGSRTIAAKSFSGDIIIGVSDSLSSSEPRRVRLESMNGKIDVTVPAALPVRCSIYTDQTIQSAFQLPKDEEAGWLKADLGPAGDRAVELTLDASMFGKVILRKR